MAGSTMAITIHWGNDMGFWNLITGAKAIGKTMDIADKTTTGVIAGFDKAFYTQEEKAETVTKRMEIIGKLSETHIELMKATASETTTRSITRRIVAIFVMIMTFLCMVTIAVTWLFNQGWALFMLELVKYFQIGIAFISVVFFFFGTYLAGKFTKK